MIPVASPLASYLAHQGAIDRALGRVSGAGDYILGREVECLEREFTDYVGASHCISVANGTDGLALALRALDIGPGQEVITASHTAVATVAAIEQAGAIPVLADIEAETYTLDFQSVRRLVTGNTAAIIPVHLYGHPADLDEAQLLREQFGLRIIEDCSQAHGAVWRDRRVGSIGDVGVFSCYPTKNLGALGDAGLIVTSDVHLGERLKGLRQYGWKERNWSATPGYNSRLDELQASILRVKLPLLDQGNNRRADIAARYSSELGRLGVKTPITTEFASHVFHLYVCEVDDRPRLQDFLFRKGVQTGIHYPFPVHLQPAYRGRVKRDELPVTEAVCDRVVSLPMYPELKDEDVDVVLQSLIDFLDGALAD